MPCWDMPAAGHSHPTFLTRAQQYPRRLALHGLGEPIALPVFTVQRLELLQLLRRFHSLGCHLHVEVLGQRPGGAEDLRTLALWPPPPEQGAVDLQCSERE